MNTQKALTLSLSKMLRSITILKAREGWIPKFVSDIYLYYLSDELNENEKDTLSLYNYINSLPSSLSALEQERLIRNFAEEIVYKRDTVDHVQNDRFEKIRKLILFEENIPRELSDAYLSHENGCCNENAQFVFNRYLRNLPPEFADERVKGVCFNEGYEYTCRGIVNSYCDALDNMLDNLGIDREN